MIDPQFTVPGHTMPNLSIEARLNSFREDLNTKNNIVIAHRRILSGDCFALTDEQHHSLREAVAHFFKVPAMEVVVVGSAKLGFSIAPKKMYRSFGNESDVDVAIASQHLFDRLWNQTYEYFQENPGSWSNVNDFRKYLFEGWVRPDFLPPSRVFPLSQEWWEFFRGLTSSDKYGRNKITGALFRSWYYLERYQAAAVNGCRTHSTEKQ
jgi:hypothetical protein